VAITFVALTIVVSIAPTLHASADIVATPAIAAGMEHTCALSDQGRVWCWGENSYGSLGDGTFTDSNVPVAVAGLADAVAISSGVRHTCALRATGTVVCWGRNDLGQLGNGNNNNSNVPTEVVTLAGATAIGSGGNHTCAIVSGGAVKCWGFGNYGQLGHAISGVGTNSNVPVAVLVGVGGPPLTGATAIDGGLRHECAIVAGGAVKCWGHNAYGQLGDGSTNDSNVPVNVVGLTGISVLGLSDSFFSCAIGGGGTVSCWGENGSGQLGNGSTNDSYVPFAVLNLPPASSVASGYAHACGSLADGTMHCWGDGSIGQLGNGADGFGVASSVPIVVPNLSGVIAVEGGYYHTCAILRSGSVRCWGENLAGQLGIGTNTNSNVPIEIQGLVLVTPIVATPAPVVALWSTTLDPAGGSCVDGATHSETWTAFFLGYRYLPGASDCTQNGFAFAGWANTTTPTTVRTFPLLVDPSDGALRSFIAENVTLVAVWNPLPATPKFFIGISNWLCNNCGVLLAWDTPAGDPTVAVTNGSSTNVCASASITVGPWALCHVKTGRPGTYTLTTSNTAGLSQTIATTVG